MSGYVYLIGSYRYKWFKIGKSRVPDIRIKDIGVLLPFKIEIVAIWKAKNHSLLESILHEKYAKNHINGEWFKFGEENVTQILKHLPEEARIYPKYNNQEESKFAKFSNIIEERSVNPVQAQIKSLSGAILTIIDASIADPVQREATKNLIKAEIRRKIDLMTIEWVINALEQYQEGSIPLEEKQDAILPL
jgi:hypothetical protein